MNNAYSPDKCKMCKTPLTPGMLRCTNKKCLHWNVNTATAMSFDEHTVLLSDAKIEVVERIRTGGFVDHIFGGGKGIAAMSVNLLAGEPGAGKTTLCLQLCDIFCEQFPLKEALYIANEQHETELKETAQRLKLKNLSRIRIVKGMGGLNFDLGDLLMTYVPCFIVLDSVTKWSGEDANLAVTICQRLKDYTVSLKAPAVVVNQVTKEGDHAGLNKMLHAVDACLMFELEYTDENVTSSESTMRRLSSTKNRNGPAPEEQFFLMMPEGLVNVDAEPSGRLELVDPENNPFGLTKAELEALNVDPEEETEDESEESEEGEDEESEDEESEGEETETDDSSEFDDEGQPKRGLCLMHNR